MVSNKKSKKPRKVLDNAKNDRYNTKKAHIGGI